MSDDYYADNRARLDTILGGDQRFYLQLRRATEDFVATHGEPEREEWHEFQLWLVEQYGVKMEMTAEGHFKTGYTIVDEMKYMLFVMKFSGG